MSNQETYDEMYWASFDRIDKLDTEKVVNLMMDAWHVLNSRGMVHPDKASELAEMIPSVDTMEDYLKRQSVLWMCLMPNFDEGDDTMEALIRHLMDLANLVYREQERRD